MVLSYCYYYSYYCYYYCYCYCYYYYYYYYTDGRIIVIIIIIIFILTIGSEVTCTIPAEFAYGKKGVCLANEGGCIVPPNETLKYFIKLKSVGAGYN